MSLILVDTISHSCPMFQWIRHYSETVWWWTQGGGLFSGFSRLCKGLSTLLVLLYLVVLVFPPALDFIALVPGKYALVFFSDKREERWVFTLLNVYTLAHYFLFCRTIPFAWNLLSAGYLEQSIFTVFFPSQYDCFRQLELVFMHNY